MAVILTRPQFVNPLWPSDAIWRQRSGSTLAQVMACYLTAPSHYLNQCWLIIRKVWTVILIWGQFQKPYLCHQSQKSPRGQWVNTLRLRQNVRRFTDDTFKRIFLNENVWMSIEISLKFVPKVPINNIPALVQIMAWRRPGGKPLSDPILVSLPTHICVTRPQWVNAIHQPFQPSLSGIWPSPSATRTALTAIPSVTSMSDPWIPKRPGASIVRPL